MNKLASRGEIGEPCGVPFSRATTVPSGICAVGSKDHAAVDNETGHHDQGEGEHDDERRDLAALVASHHWSSHGP